MQQLLSESLRLVFYVIVFAAVVIGAKFTTEFVAKRNRGLIASRRIRLIERVPLSKDRDILLIEWENMQYLLSSTSKSTVVIDKSLLQKTKGEDEK
ncbi:MAG: flagellar biosynthetic protein FliO [Peptostreptococcaceae bacterium]|nr:flagellar biosynthetic protein FliO [Peptostreptococcaceae bacterium]